MLVSVAPELALGAMLVPVVPELVLGAVLEAELELELELVPIVVELIVPLVPAVSVTTVFDFFPFSLMSSEFFAPVLRDQLYGVNWGRNYRVLSSDRFDY